MTAQERVLQTAIAELGYLEKRDNKLLDDKTANAGANNYTKYARDLDAIKGFYNGKKQSSSWCDVFVDWCFVRAFGPELAAKVLCQPWGGLGAGVKYSAQYYQAKGRFYETGPRPGDQAFFVRRKGLTVTAWLHTALVEKVENGYVYTIEGNTSGANGVVSNGGGVWRKKYKLNDPSIGGYGRPNWDLVKEANNEVTKEEVKTIVDEAMKPLSNKLDELTTTYYYKVEELPAWAQPVVLRLISSGVITGDGIHEINLTDNDLRTVSMVDKLLGRVEGR